jgi:hypothetical protein
MCTLSNFLSFLDRKSESAAWYQRARDVGAAHGFFSLESKACTGLGMAAVTEGRDEEGLALLRNALVAAELNELDDPAFELDALKSLIKALFSTNSIDEVEPLVLRYREAAKAQSEKEGAGVCFAEFESLLFSARLHEVLCHCTPHLVTPLHGSVIASSTAIQRLTIFVTGCDRTREKTHAPVEPCALCRHAEGLKRPRGRCVLCST